jgi:hypothetical protein
MAWWNSGVVRAASRALDPTPPIGSGYASPWQNNDHLVGLTFDELFSVDPDGLNQPVSRAQAMSIGTVARARNVVCPTIGRLPLVVMNQAGPVVAPEYDFIRQPESSPDAMRPGYLTYLWSVDAMKFYGRAWWVVTKRYAETNRPQHFKWVPEWDARLDNGRLIGTLSGEKFDQADVIRIDGPDEGVLNFATRELRMALRLDRAAAQVADNPVPALNLQEQPGVTQRLDSDEVDAVISKWRAARRAGVTVGYTPSSLKPEVLGLQVEQLLIEGRKYGALQLTRVMNVPAWVADVAVEGSSLTYSNVASRSRELVDFGLMPYLSAIEARLSMDDILPRGVWCRYDLTELLRGDFGDRMAAYKIAKESEVYDLDELRALENLPGRTAEPTEES